jgi:SAM-dependent methyltransferase
MVISDAKMTRSGHFRCKVERVSGRGAIPGGRWRLLDLACGTGQLAFALRGSFAEIWAVDQEPDMVEAVAAKAAAAGAGHIRPVVSSAEDLDAPAGHFELAVIGTAFHQLRRDAVARLAYDWLAPGGFLALCWSSGPSAGSREWHLAFSDLMKRWQAAFGASDRVPPRTGLGRGRSGLMLTSCPVPGSRRPAASSSATSTSVRRAQIPRPRGVISIVWGPAPPSAHLTERIDTAFSVHGFEVPRRGDGVRPGQSGLGS